MLLLYGMLCQVFLTWKPLKTSIFHFPQDLEHTEKYIRIAGTHSPLYKGRRGVPIFEFLPKKGVQIFPIKEKGW